MLRDLKYAIQLTTLSRSTIYRRIGDGTFPRPMRLSYRRIAWHDADLQAFIANLK